MEAHIKIEGITCAGCLNRIGSSLTSLGVFRFDYDFYSKQATVIYDEETLEVDEIEETINALGYQAESI